MPRDSASGGDAYTHWGDREGQYGQPRGHPWEASAVPKAPQLADKLQGEALYGVNPVLGALQAKRRECHTLYVQECESTGLRKPFLVMLMAFLSQTLYMNMLPEQSAGCLTNFLPSQWQKIKWRLPKSKAGLRTSTPAPLLLRFPTSACHRP